MTNPKDSTQAGPQTTFSRLHESLLGEKYYSFQHFYMGQIPEYQLFKGDKSLQNITEHLYKTQG